MSGMRPTGRLHLGNFFGALANWVELAKHDETFFEVADYHALTTAFERTGDIAPGIHDVALDIGSASGIDPGTLRVVYVQSALPEIAEMQSAALDDRAGCVAAARRRPSKIKSRRSAATIATYGFLGYPLMQLVDIAIVRANGRAGRSRSTLASSNSAARSCGASTISSGRHSSSRRRCSRRIPRRPGNGRPQDVEVVRQRDRHRRRRRDHDQEDPLYADRSAEDPPPRPGQIPTSAPSSSCTTMVNAERVSPSIREANVPRARSAASIARASARSASTNAMRPVRDRRAVDRPGRASRGSCNRAPRGRARSLARRWPTSRPR